MTRLRLFGISVFVFLASCAQINELTGGMDDETSPAIDSAKTYPFNGQTNFTGNEVRIRFDEYIILNKPNDNIIITPRPAVQPEIKSHNKTLTITFPEPLEDNTTYTISFNHAVSDITEKNDSVFQYVFSTGDYIDSLFFSGSVTDGFTNEGSNGFLVALYPASTDAGFDSIPYKFKPTYIAQTDKGGNFSLNYLKEGVYYLYAFADKNKNLLLESNEAVAFMEERTILVNNETSRVRLKSFKQAGPDISKISTVSYDSPGRLKLIFTMAPDSFAVSTTMPLLEEVTGKPDSLIFWLAQNPTPKMRFVTYLDGETDTLKPVYKTTTEKVKLLGIMTTITEGKLMPGEPLQLTLSEPVRPEGINMDRIQLITSDSTVLVPEFEIENVRTLVLKNELTGPATLTIDSAAFTSVYGTINIRSETFVFENHPQSYFGSLVVNTDSVLAVPGIVYLLDSKRIPVDTMAYAPVMHFVNLLPGEYQLQLVIDANGDGGWTTGSLKDGRLPEKVIYFNEPVTIKSKWEKEIDWVLKE